MPLTKIRDWKGWKQWGAMLTCVVALTTLVSAAIAWAGVNIPSPVWESQLVEHTKAAEEAIKKESQQAQQQLINQAIKLNETNQEMNQRILDADKRRLRELKIEEYRIQTQGNVVPEFYLEQKLDLEEEIEDRVKKIDDLKEEQVSLELKRDDIIKIEITIEDVTAADAAADSN